MGQSEDSVENSDLTRVPLQAIILADNITTLFEPITLECPKSLLQSVNAPMIDHKLSWLESANVEEVFILSPSHSNQIINHLHNSNWVNKPNLSVTTIESHNALRNVIQGDFILVSGDTVTNMNLTEALQEHKKRKQKDKNTIMTMIIKQSKPSEVVTDELIMAIDPTTKQLKYYEDKTTNDLKFNKSFLTVNPCLSLHNDKQDCYIDICSPQSLTHLFTKDIDFVDYQNLRGDFFKGLLVDDELTGFKIFTHEIDSSYYAEFLLINKPAKLESDTTESDVAIIIESNSQIFEKKAKAIFLTAVSVFQDPSVAFYKLFRLRLYYRIRPGKCAGVLIYLMMKLALDKYSNNSGKNDLVKETYDVILKWEGRLLRGFLRGVNDQIHVILKFEEICLEESMKEYAPLFVQVLYILYARSLIKEEAILKWANKKKHADESDKVFVKQSEKFIQWLKEPSEEKYQEFKETDLKRLDEGGVQVRKSRFIKSDLKRSNESRLQVKKSRSMKRDLKRLNEGGVQVKKSRSMS